MNMKKIKRVVIAANERSNWQKSWGGAFGEGLKRHDVSVDYDRHFTKKYDMMVVWSTRNTRLIQRERARGTLVCILERGYLGDRFFWTSVSFGGRLNGNATFKGPFQDSSRWKKHFSGLMMPWHFNPDGYALILEQVKGDMSLVGVNIDEFYAKAIRAFKDKMSVKVRRHPRTKKGDGAKHIAALESLQTDLAGAQVAITWNSNSGVDAVLAGVPTIAMDRGSMAWPVTGHKLVKPGAPDRDAWAHALAWKQYSHDEMRSGYCWEMIRDGGEIHGGDIGSANFGVTAGAFP